MNRSTPVEQPADEAMTPRQVDLKDKLPGMLSQQPFQDCPGLASQLQG